MKQGEKIMVMCDLCDGEGLRKIDGVKVLCMDCEGTGKVEDYYEPEFDKYEDRD